MTLRMLGRGLGALLVPLVCGGLLMAGDPPRYGGAAAGGMPCVNCERVKAAVGSDCPTCVNGKYGIGWRKRPTVPTLAPGACFGYFPTQWNKWEDVCPLPYNPPAEAAAPGKRPTPPPIPPANLPDDGKKPAGNGAAKPAEPPKSDAPPAKPADPKPVDPKPADPKAGAVPMPTIPPIPDAVIPPTLPKGKF